MESWATSLPRPSRSVTVTVNLILAGTPSLSMERSDWVSTIALPALEPTSSDQILSLLTLCSPALFSVYLVQATSLYGQDI
jgi:hypothetical protein